MFNGEALFRVEYCFGLSFCCFLKSIIFKMNGSLIFNCVNYYKVSELFQDSLCYSG